jgi:hypothetical protein
LYIVKKTHPKNGFDILFNNRRIIEFTGAVLDVEADTLFFDAQIAADFDFLEPDLFLCVTGTRSEQQKGKNKQRESSRLGFHE